jgi:hypothetical protein
MFLAVLVMQSFLGRMGHPLWWIGDSRWEDPTSASEWGVIGGKDQVTVDSREENWISEAEKKEPTLSAR